MDVDQDTPLLPEAQPSSSGQSLVSGNVATMPSQASSTQVADALERILRQQRAEQRERSGSYTAFDEDHEKRQEFRRMIDPGILRPNARPLALESLRTLLKIAENILQNPDEPKYWKFKPTNANIKRLLVDPKGTLEYARAMGFNPEVDNFQPYYVFNRKKHLRDLQVGAEIVKEALEREMTKEERQERARREEKAVAAAQVANIKQAFLDDRKSRSHIDRREKELREARAAAATNRSSEPPASPSPPATNRMPGSGHLLSGGQVTLADAPNTQNDDDDD